MKKTQRNRFKKQERLKKWKLRKRGKQKLLQKFLKQQREFPINKVGLVFSTMIISKKSTASFTHSSPPKQAPVHVNEAQKKPKTITSNTGAASPTSSILILGEPVLNSGKTSSHDHAKKNADNKGTSCSFCVASLKIQIWAFPHGKKMTQQYYGQKGNWKRRCFTLKCCFHSFLGMLPFLKPYDNTKIGENISKITSLGRFMENKAKGTFSELVLKTTNKSGCFSTKAFIIVRGTTMERHACSYTVWRDVSLKFLSAK